jgi:hypothetical protein
MAQITPIADRRDIHRRMYKKVLLPMLGSHRLRLAYLPMVNVVPEHFVKYHYDVELIIACLKYGCWIEEPWQPYLRYTIAKRLRVRTEILSREPFTDIWPEFLKYQLYGGTFKQQDRLKVFAAKILTAPKSHKFDTVRAKLFQSVLDEIVDNAVVQPLHWIRASLAVSDNPVYGMNLATSEGHKQKVTLCKMLRATLPD